MLGPRLAELRKKKGLSQYEMADRLGVSRGKLANYEQGSRQPDFDTLSKLADFFDVTTDYLLGRSDTLHLSEQEEFEAFANDPDLRVFYLELPTSKEEEVRMLRDMWEIIKSNRENK